MISCDDAVALKNAEYESAKGTNAVSSYSNGKLNVKITSTSGKIKDLGTLKIEGVNVGIIEFEAKGNVVYDLETLYDVVSALNEKLSITRFRIVASSTLPNKPKLTLLV